MITLSTQNGEKEILTKGSFPSYNGFLFDARLKMGLRRRKFAKFLGISPFRYRFIENGYLKPHEKDVIKFTAALGIDCSFMREGISSTYPDELPDKERNKVVDWAYRFIGSFSVL